MVIKLKGPSEPFPLIIAQVQHPAKSCTVKMPWRPIVKKAIWAWKATGSQWELYDGQIPIQDYDPDPGGLLGGWILVKFS